MAKEIIIRPVHSPGETKGYPSAQPPKPNTGTPSSIPPKLPPKPSPKTELSNR